MVYNNVLVGQELLGRNRAETAVRLFKRMWHVMKVDLDDPRIRGVTVREVVKKVVWARNCQLTISGYSPIEIATGRRPPDLLTLRPQALSNCQLMQPHKIVQI